MNPLRPLPMPVPMHVPMHVLMPVLMPALVPLALLTLVAIAQPGLVSPGTLGLLAGEASVLLLLASGQTLVVLLGGIDVSMAALAALGSVLMALWLPMLGAGGVAGVLALATLLGGLQGWVHAHAQLPSVMVTLAGLGIWSGLALLIGHTTVPVSAGYDSIAWLEGSTAGVPHAFAFALGALLLLAAGLHTLRFGRQVRAIGFRPTAALMSGIPVQRVKTLAFALCGLFSGLAAMVMVARTASGSPTIADSLLLPSIAAVLVGGTSLSGGRGGLLRTLLGVFTVTLLRLGAAAAGLDPAYEPIAYGVLVVLAAAAAAPRDGSGSVK